MPRHQHIINDVCSYDSSSSEELYSRIRRPRHGRHGSVASSHHHHHVHEPAIAGQHLAVPVVDVGRKRASSASGLPQPNIIINTDGGSRSRSRERARPRSRSGGRRYEHDDDMFEEIIERRGRISRSPSPYYRYDHETRKALERLSIFEREKAEEEAQERYKAELEVHKAKEQLKKEKEKELAKKAVDDWHKEQAAKKEKARKEKEEQDKLVEERLKELIGSDAYEERKYVNERRLAHSRPTYIKVHRRYLLPETLNVFELPWSYDSVRVPFQSCNWTTLIFPAG